MANVKLITGTAAIFVCSTGDQPSGAVIINVDDASSLAMDIQARVTGAQDSTGAASTLADITYYNMLSDPRTKVTAGTDVTADGIYGVVAPGMDIYVKPSAGSCTLTWVSLAGPLA